MVSAHQLEAIANAQVGYQHSYVNGTHWIGATNPTITEPFGDNPGKFITVVSNVRDWDTICQGVAAGEFFWEAKISYFEDPEINGHWVCIYGPSDKKRELATALRKRGLSHVLFWKSDRETREGRDGMASISHICEVGDVIQDNPAFGR